MRRSLKSNHLGNIRMSYTKDPQTGDLKILEENHYYPFGLKHSRYAPLVGRMSAINNDTDKAIVPINPNDQFARQSVYKYKYNGKELQDELGLGLYDYGARNYDPALGRWFGIDNASEKYYRHSPYHYAGNNPVRNIDLDGNEFTEDAWEWVNKLIADINSRQNSNNDDIAKYQAKIEAGGNKRQLNSWNKKIANYKANNAELEGVRGEIATLAGSDQVYDVVPGGSTQTDMMGNRKTTNSFGFNFNNGRAEIKVSSGTSLDLFAHELKHAYQFERGEISVGSIFKNHPNLGTGTLFYDKYDELEAYKRGNLFGGSETYTNINQLPEMYDRINNNVSNINSVSTRHPGFKRAVQNNNVQALQQFSNSINTAFRVNGRTYYPGQKVSQ